MVPLVLPGRNVLVDLLFQVEAYRLRDSTPPRRLRLQEHDSEFAIILIDWRLEIHTDRLGQAREVGVPKAHPMVMHVDDA